MSENYTVMSKLKSKTSLEILLEYIGEKNIDIIFLILMIQHHKGGIKTIKKLNANYIIVENLANEINTSSKKEIQYMENLLDELNDNEMDEKEMNELEKIVKSDMTLMMFHRNFCTLDDVLFSILMTQHHSFAIEMSYIIIKFGNDLNVKKFAKHIIETQSKQKKTFAEFINRHFNVINNSCIQIDH